jgi:hypothetical protein
MTRSHRRAAGDRRRFQTIATVSILAAALLAAVTLNAEADEPLPRSTVVVFGDSISNQFTDDPGDPMQGWWSILAAKRGMSPFLSAQGGGGILKPGYGCFGTSIRERFRAVVTRVRPTEIWIAAGKNDVAMCKNGTGVSLSPTFRTRAMASFFASVGAVADELGVPRTSVYVTTPWGVREASGRAAIVMDMARGARAAGLTYINVPHMSQSQTRDGTHPNLKGSRFIADYMAPRMVPR